jgi:hypothetical protein
LELFVERWLNENCFCNGWCYEADLNYDSSVDFLDYAELAVSWLREKIPADIDGDWDVDFTDFAILADYWMDGGCGEPGWCGGADLDETGQVNVSDLLILTEHWLQRY